ncbi:MAG: orotidine-5'-phosphate decarboxylase [Pseudomonadota bacterium]
MAIILKPHERILCALDTNDLNKAKTMVKSLAGDGEPLIGGIKLGLEFFSALGAPAVNQLRAEGLPVFLDLKFHDIPNTVAGAVRSAMVTAPNFLTIHASGGAAMIEAAAEAAKQAADSAQTNPPVLLAVTVLTSLDADDLSSVGQDRQVSDQVRRLGELAVRSGANGLVCAPFEVRFLREALGDDVVLVVPGVRPSWAAKNDQKRVMSPVEAIDAGADYLVIGRPITASADPVDAARNIVTEIEAGV